MKVSREELSKIIQEEINKLISEEKNDKKSFLKKASKALGGLFKGFERGSSQKYSNVNVIPDPTDWRYSEKQKTKTEPTKKDSSVSIAGLQEPETQFSFSSMEPSDVAEPDVGSYMAPSSEISEPTKSSTGKPSNLQIKFLVPTEEEPEIKKSSSLKFLQPTDVEPETNKGQMDLFGDYAEKVKKDELSKVMWQKMLDSAKNEPNQPKAIERLQAIANSPQAHPDIKKQAKRLVDRYLAESKNNLLFNKWQKIIKG